MKIHHILKKFLKLAKNIWIIRIYLGLLFVWIIVYFYKNKEALATLLEVSHFEIALLVLALSFIIFLCFVYVHYSTYQALDTEISYWQTFQVVAFSRLGVYIPGKIFYGANYYIFSRFLNIGADKIGKNFIVNTALLFFTGALCSLFAISQLPFVAQYFLIILPFFMIVIIHPKFLDKIFLVLMSKLSQFFPESKAVGSMDDMKGMSWNYRLYLKFIAFYIFLWFILGVMLFLCIIVFEPMSIQKFPVVMAAGASGLIIGLLAVFAPGGLGVREGVSIIILSQTISLESAVFACFLLRLSHVIADLVVGGIAAIAFLRKKRSFRVEGTGDVRS